MFYNKFAYCICMQVLRRGMLESDISDGPSISTDELLYQYNMLHII